MNTVKLKNVIIILLIGHSFLINWQLFTESIIVLSLYLINTNVYFMTGR